MSTDSEREIRGRLGAALGTITPPPAPVDAVIHRGRSIRRRRRIGVAAGLAAVVGLGVALPGLVSQAHSAPPLSRSYRVTVNTPHVTPSKVTFSGTIDGRKWDFAAEWNHGHPMEFGPQHSENDISDLQPGGSPANLEELGTGQQDTLIGQFRSDVSYLVLTHADGTDTYVFPVRWHGALWAGLTLPARLQLTRVTAYSQRGEVAYAVPFGTNGIVTWLRPGQHGLPRQTARIAAGTFDGHPWSYHGYAGPWGICFQGEGSGWCPGLGSPLARGHLVGMQTCGGGSGPSQLLAGQAGQDVGYLKIRLAHGVVVRATATELAGYRFWAVEIPEGQRVLGWTAYRASGQVLGSGPGWRVC
jgi:hypothetical protein